MNYDQFGRLNVTVNDLCSMLYKNPDLDVSYFLVTDPVAYNNSVQSLYAGTPLLQQYKELDLDIEQFDQACQQHWFMPAEYKDMDIAQWILDQCKTQAELQRVAQELFLFQERNLFPLLCYLKYLVDTMRKHNIVWGVGRGSSVASYVLFLLGIHKINSLYYDLPIDEFLKETNEKII